MWIFRHANSAAWLALVVERVCLGISGMANWPWLSFGITLSRMDLQAVGLCGHGSSLPARERAYVYQTTMAACGVAEPCQ